MSYEDRAAFTAEVYSERGGHVADKLHSGGKRKRKQFADIWSPAKKEDHIREVEQHKNEELGRWNKRAKNAAIDDDYKMRHQGPFSQSNASSSSIGSATNTRAFQQMSLNSRSNTMGNIPEAGGSSTSLAGHKRPIAELGDQVDSQKVRQSIEQAYAPPTQPVFYRVVQNGPNEKVFHPITTASFSGPFIQPRQQTPPTQTRQQTPPAQQGFFTGFENYSYDDKGIKRLQTRKTD